MIRDSRLFSVGRGGVGLPLAAVMFAVGLAIGLGIAPVTASRGAHEPQASPPIERPAASRMIHAVEVLRVVDGDTFDARVNLWPGLYTTTRVRLRGIDAPEMSARCAEERAKAEVARDVLRVILDRGGVGIAQVAFDKYSGRVLADVLTQATPDVSGEMLATGHVRPYSGGRRETWCDADQRQR